MVFLILAAGNMSSLINLPVHGGIGTTGELRIWLVICFAVLLPCSWLGTPKEFWGIAIGASLATAVACLMICVCIGLDLPADLKTVQQPTVNFESFFSGMKTTCHVSLLLCAVCTKICHYSRWLITVFSFVLDGLILLLVVSGIGQ